MQRTAQFSIAPDKLWQSINPWTFYQQGAQFGIVNIDLGRTPNPALEQKILDDVGTYGRQLGRIGDAFEVLLRHMPLGALTPEEADTIAILRGQLAEVRRIKARDKA